MQKSFNPIDYHFTFTADYYEWNEEAARRDALKARNAFAKQMKDSGYTVRKSTLKNQLISRGGIGSGNPHIEIWIPSIYMVDVY